MNDARPQLTILQGDCLKVLKSLPAESVHCCVTSPPYWGLRDYGVAGQIGLEDTPADYVAKMVAVFREVWRVLRQDGTCWINLGDTYASTGGHSDAACNDRRGQYNIGNRPEHNRREFMARPSESSFRRDKLPVGNIKHKYGGAGMKPKDLCGIPWRVAFALQEDGWYLRSDVIWHKPNPMPESVTDRPTKSHEYIFLLSKSERYFYDAEAIKEMAIANHPAGNKTHKGATAYLNGATEHRTKQGLVAYAQRTNGKTSSGDTRNKRSVWTVPTAPFKEAHFATFPPDLIKPCILAGCPVGGTVLDPFGGSGTTGMVALELGRKAVLIELNPEYVEMQKRRCDVTPGLPI